MIDINRICQNCFQSTDITALHCSHCGRAPLVIPFRSIRCLPQHTILAGRYLVGRVLGEGGFGITYLALDLVREERTAIKEYFPVELATRDQSEAGHNTIVIGSGDLAAHFNNGMRRFVREAETLRQFESLPGIVSVRDFFQENKTAYLVMNYIEGGSLSQYLRTYTAQNGHPIPYDAALSLMRPVLRSLQKVHEEGIIHRDISPENLLLDEKGQIVLIDFGSAKPEYTAQTSHSMTVMVKHGYAPQEQYRAHGEHGAFTDIYAVCATLYHMISGELPEDAIERLIEDHVTPLDQLDLTPPVPEEYAGVIRRGMQIRPEDRYQTMEELLSDLARADAVIEKKRLAAEKKARQEEAARLAAEEKARQEEAARLAAEEKARQEEAARLAAEEKARQEEAAKPAQTSVQQKKTAGWLPRRVLGNSLIAAAAIWVILIVVGAFISIFTERGAVQDSDIERQEEEKKAAEEAAEEDSSEENFQEEYEESGNAVSGIVYSDEEKESYYQEALSLLGSLADRYGGDSGVESPALQDPDQLGDAMQAIYDTVSTEDPSAYEDYWVVRSELMQAAIAFGKAAGYKNAAALSNCLWGRFGCCETIDTGYDNLAAIREDGSTVICAPHSLKGTFEEVGRWENIVSVLWTSYSNRLIGLRSDGTMLCSDEDGWSELELDKWSDLVEIVWLHDRGLAGLRSDGTVVLQIVNEDGTLMHIDDPEWNQITHIAGGDTNLIATRADGAVLTADFSWQGKEEFQSESFWSADGEPVYRDFEEAGEIFGEYGYTVSEIADLTVDSSYYDQNGICKRYRKADGYYDGVFLLLDESGSVSICRTTEDSKWPGSKRTAKIEEMTDIIDLDLDYATALFIHSDGSVGMVTTIEGEHEDFAQVTTLADASAVSTYRGYAAAIVGDGSLVFAGDYALSAQLDCDGWTGVTSLSTYEFNDVYGICGDGSVKAACRYLPAQEQAETWKNMRCIRSDGIGLSEDGSLFTVSSDGDLAAELEEWTNSQNIVSITDKGMLAGLTAEGTVYLGTGTSEWRANADRSCEEWTDITAIAATSSRIMGLRANGTVVLSNAQTQAGVDEANPNEEEVLKLTNVVRIEGAYWDYFAVLTEDGTVYCTDETFEVPKGKKVEDFFFSNSILFCKTSDGWEMYGDEGSLEYAAAIIPPDFLKDQMKRVILGDNSTYAIALFEDGTVKTASLSLSSSQAMAEWKDLRGARRP